MLSIRSYAASVLEDSQLRRKGKGEGCKGKGIYLLLTRELRTVAQGWDTLVETWRMSRNERDKGRGEGRSRRTDVHVPRLGVKRTDAKKNGEKFGGAKKWRRKGWNGEGWG